VYAEYEEVTRRPRLCRDHKVIIATLHAIREKSLWVKPAEAIRACADPDDDIFLEYAQAAKAAYLVTGNLKHFPASWLDTRIVTPGRFLEITTGETEEAPV
jgi:predicted nucleic acid-binding protein